MTFSSLLVLGFWRSLVSFSLSKTSINTALILRPIVLDSAFPKPVASAVRSSAAGANEGSKIVAYNYDNHDPKSLRKRIREEKEKNME